jgi:citronellyl-CoA dehydrogenase
LTGFQTVRHEIVQMEAELEAGRQLAYRAVDLVVRGEDAMREITMAKLICGDLSTKVMDRCLQLHGGMGYMDECDISRAWRDARLITIGGGTSEIMREILSKAMI